MWRPQRLFSHSYDQQCWLFWLFHEVEETKTLLIEKGSSAPRSKRKNTLRNLYIGRLPGIDFTDVADFINIWHISKYWQKLNSHFPVKKATFNVSDSERILNKHCFLVTRRLNPYMFITVIFVTVTGLYFNVVQQVVIIFETFYILFSKTLKPITHLTSHRNVKNPPQWVCGKDSGQCFPCGSTTPGTQVVNSSPCLAKTHTCAWLYTLWVV